MNSTSFRSKHSDLTNTSKLPRPHQPDKDISSHMHPETLKFLRKYFPDFLHKEVSVAHFVAEILIEYEGLWTPEQGRSV